MGIVEIILLSVGLAMDAFAVSVCKGLSMEKIEIKRAIIIALWFGGFQALMPVIGYALGSSFEHLITSIDHWIAFVLLLSIGINMIKESFDDENEKRNDNIDIKTMFGLAVATSIDALAVGITMAFFDVHLISTIIAIGIITFALSLVGVKVGNKFGDKFQNKAELLGGIILILIGTKILLQHLGIL